jgi:hypothetical protein
VRRLALLAVGALAASCGDNNDTTRELEPLNECSATDLIVQLQRLRDAVVTTDIELVAATAIAFHSDLEVFDLSAPCPQSPLEAGATVTGGCTIGPGPDGYVSRACDFAITEGGSEPAITGSATIEGILMEVSLAGRFSPGSSTKLSSGGWAWVREPFKGELGVSQIFPAGGLSTGITLHGIEVDDSRCPIDGSLVASRGAFECAGANPCPIPTRHGAVEFGPSCE